MHIYTWDCSLLYKFSITIHTVIFILINFLYVLEFQHFKHFNMGSVIHRLMLHLPYIPLFYNSPRMAAWCQNTVFNTCYKLYFIKCLCWLLEVCLCVTNSVYTCVQIIFSATCCISDH